MPSLAGCVNKRKRPAIDINLNDAHRKVLVVDSSDSIKTSENASEKVNALNSDSVTKDALRLAANDRFQETGNEIVPNNNIKGKNNLMKTAKKIIKKVIITSASQKFQQRFTNTKKDDKVITQTDVGLSEKIEDIEKHLTPPNTPTKISNALDIVKSKPDGPSLKEIGKKMARSSRLAELKASLNRFQENADKLKEVEKKTSLIPESPKMKSFKMIELEVQTSPRKVNSPEKSYLSPVSVLPENPRNCMLIETLKPALTLPYKYLSPVSVLPENPTNCMLIETLKPALTLPYKYRYLSEIFRCIDIVCQILFNRKETITFRKLKQAVEEMLKRTLTEKHLAQIRKVYPGSFEFTQEKLKVFGAGAKQERWELVLTPKIGTAKNMNPEVLLHRRRKLFNTLLDKVKFHHQVFLLTLRRPMVVHKDKITRWHPEFNIEKLPDIEAAPLPQPPIEEVLPTGKDVLEKARKMFSYSRMKQALQRLKEPRDKDMGEKQLEEPKAMSTSVLKGIPNALLKKVRQRQAAKALLSMTRSADQEKEVQIYSRLPELARLTRNLFVFEKKSALLLDVVMDKLGNCYRENLSKVEMEKHLRAISEEVPTWLVFHDMRKQVYLKIDRTADVTVVVNKLEDLVRQKSYCD